MAGPCRASCPIVLATVASIPHRETAFSTGFPTSEYRVRSLHPHGLASRPAGNNLRFGRNMDQSDCRSLQFVCIYLRSARLGMANIASARSGPTSNGHGWERVLRAKVGTLYEDDCN